MTLPTAVSLSSGKTGKKPTMLGPLDKADLHPQAWKQSIWLNIQGPPKKCIHSLTDGICVLFSKLN